MKIIAIKEMSVGNDSVGEMWKETKIFDASDSLIDVMKWGKLQTKNIILTIPENDKDEFKQLTK